VTKTGGLRALRLEALADPSLPGGGPGRATNANIGLSQIQVLASPAGGGAARGVKLMRPRATFQQNDGSLSIASALDDLPGTGWAVDPQFGQNHAAIFEFAEPLDHAGGTRLEVRLEFSLNVQHNIGRPRLAVTTAAEPGLEAEGLPAGVAVALEALSTSGSTPAALTADHRTALLPWWRTTDPGWSALHEAVVDHEKMAPQPRLTKVLVCAEGYPPVRMHTQGADFFPETHVLARGSTDLKQGVATAGFLQVLMPNPDAVDADPANALCARRTPRRLEAEAVLDSLLFVSGMLDPTMFGPGTLDQASRRRSIYFTVKRSQMIPAMQAFDAPEPLVSQGQRQTTTVAPQALMLMNSPHVRAWAANFAKRCAADPAEQPAAAVNAAYTRALNRPPTDQEREDADAFIEAQTERHRADHAAGARMEALVDFAQVVLSLNEFIYVD